jgi:predicted RNA polymerase sigma factor
MARYHLLGAVRGDVLLRLGRNIEAAEKLERAAAATATSRAAAATATSRTE